MTQRLAVLLLVPALVAGQKSPPRRAHHALVYDEANARVLLSGGSTPNGGQCCTFFNDLWSFDGKEWTELPSSGPMMSGMRLVWDSRAKQVVSFGGFSHDNQPMSDLRVLRAGAWTTHGPNGPVPSAEGGFVYDSARGRFIAFGGSGGQGQANSATWAFANGTWTEVETIAPPPRQAMAMAYDERRGVAVMFGGMGIGAPPTPPPSFGDTYEFRTRWRKINYSGERPSPRHSAGFAYDAKRGRMILFGGIDAKGFRGDTWSWDGERWTKLLDESPTGPEPRGMGYLAYDKKRDRVVLFGGRKGWPDGDLNDTWEFDGKAWKRVGR